MKDTRTYETIVGYFIQDDPGPNPTGSRLRELPARFGLIDDHPERWSKFTASIQQLNVDAPSHVRYKVFFLGRHGEGYHNVANAKYGDEVRLFRATSSYWCKLNGDGVLTWGPDPDLTPIGEGQAEAARALWETELQFGIPLPNKMYCSPISRAIQTHKLTFRGLLPNGSKATLVENTREKIGIESCNRRRTRTDIQRKFPDYLIEDGFTEDDELWRPDVLESYDDIDVRVRTVLEMIFRNDEEQLISITSHWAFINAFLRVTGHPDWALPTGGVVPLVVKASLQYDPLDA
ncbi:hypothetical protein SCLCIDRAFT_1218294 [Scleroderma citrinum Foug A]|uniref:Phosphoglycerate mutase n=1 Tax=Scleroderma citrinum Foug A TaxID=1036808 RepID=A0A0C3DDH1_9AGAM|nr:hypothetical protein SCLCIDRAFT_1218294 [Scleroderma citrinum Foug A]